MNQNHALSLLRLNVDPAYRELARKAFGSPILDLARVEKAIASFERTLLSGNSPFDRYEYGGDKTALSPSQMRGLAVFQDSKRGNCTACHSVGSRYALFTDGKFHKVSIGVRDDGSLDDIGRYQQTNAAPDTGAFERRRFGT